LEVVSRDAASVAARILLTTQDGSIHLLRNNEHIWTREESLSHILPEITVFLDLPVPEPKGQLHVSSADILSAYIGRVTAHIRQLRNLPAGLAAFARHFATGRYEEVEVGSVNRDAFGLRKFVIVASRLGKLLALDSANGGNVVWSRILPAGTRVKGMWVLRESSARRGKPPVIGVLTVNDSLDSKFLQVDGLTGQILVQEDVGDVPIVKSFLAPGETIDSEQRRIVVAITDDHRPIVLPSSSEEASLFSTLADKVYFSVREADAIQGFVLDSVYPPVPFVGSSQSFEAIPTWRFEAPADSHIATLSFRRPDENVASIGRVLGDRSVLYKYLNPNLIVVSVVHPTTSVLTVYLLDNVSGGIIVEFKYEDIDVSKTVATEITENSVYWAYYGNGNKGEQGRGTRVTAVELYELQTKNVKYNMYLLPRPPCFPMLMVLLGQSGLRLAVNIRMSWRGRTCSTIQFTR
jgi:ER membrane protein complex subunit 1